MSADPLTLGIGGAVLGGMMDKDNPLRGAALGGLGGAIGGPAFSAVEGAAAPGMAGAVGSGITGGSAFGANAAGGMAAEGALGGGLGGSSMQAGLLGGQGAGMAGAGAGISQPMSLLGMTAGETAPSLSMAGHMGKLGSAMDSTAMGEKALNMGGQMLLKQEQAKQGQPVMPGVAPPQMRPNFAMPSFMQSAPNFRPAIGGLPMNNPVAANPRMRG